MIALEFESTGAGLLGLYSGNERVLQLCGLARSKNLVAVLDLRLRRVDARKLQVLATLLVSAAGRVPMSAARYAEISLDASSAHVFTPDIVWENASLTSLHVLA